MNKEKNIKAYFDEDSEWNKIANIFNQAMKRKGLNKKQVQNISQEILNAVRNKDAVFNNATNVQVIRGRENIPIEDNFTWWTMHYEYRNKKTNEVFKLEDLQQKYNLGFLQKELWDIIECQYISEEVYIMNINHPKYNKSDDIVFED